MPVLMKRCAYPTSFGLAQPANLRDDDRAGLRPAAILRQSPGSFPD